MHHLVAIIWLHLQVMWPIISPYIGWFIFTVQFLATCWNVWGWYQQPETFPVYRVGRWTWRQAWKLWRRLLSTLRQFRRK